MADRSETGIIPTLLEGSSDPQEKQAAAPGGERGERTGDVEAEGYRHTTAGDIPVEETSGVAFAEAVRVPEPPKGRAGSSAPSQLPWFVIGGAIGLAAGFLLRSRPKVRRAATVHVIRDAGLESMRDTEDRAWTRVDEASDQSFPASDPPATY